MPLPENRMIPEKNVCDRAEIDTCPNCVRIGEIAQELSERGIATS